jgi:hypothetical protein
MEMGTEILLARMKRVSRGLRQPRRRCACLSQTYVGTQLMREVDESP